MTPEEFVKKLNAALKAAGFEDRVRMIKKKSKLKGFFYYWDAGYDGAICYVVISPSGRVTEYVGAYEEDGMSLSYDYKSTSVSVDRMIARTIKAEKDARGPLTGD